jgi:hypothetical protein
VLYFVPPGAISIADAVYWLASRKDDGRSYCWVSLYMAWQELREAIRTRKLPGYIVDGNGQTHEADCAQFAGLWDYDPIRLASCEFLAAAPQVHIKASPYTALRIPFPSPTGEIPFLSPTDEIVYQQYPAPMKYSYSTERISGQCCVMKSDLEKVFAKVRPTSKRGSKPKYDWPKIKAWAFELMDKRGEFDGRKWYQESLIRKLLELCSNEFGREPDRSTLIEGYLPGWLEEWQE